MVEEPVYTRHVGVDCASSRTSYLRPGTRSGPPDLGHSRPSIGAVQVRWGCLVLPRLGLACSRIIPYGPGHRGLSINTLLTEEAQRWYS